MDFDCNYLLGKFQSSQFVCSEGCKIILPYSKGCKIRCSGKIVCANGIQCVYGVMQGHGIFGANSNFRVKQRTKGKV